MRVNSNSYFILFYDANHKCYYKIPVGFFTQNGSFQSSTHTCLNTFYSTTHLPIYESSKFSKNITDEKLLTYKPVHFERFKYIGKGFKLILKRKRGMFNCIFGHSHIYWVRLQSIFIKRTKKYKYVFATHEKSVFIKMLNILKKIKPINRYTLRGVRTYTHVWIKRKGRKSVATHV
jgi:hypothetical protein